MIVALQIQEHYQLITSTVHYNISKIKICNLSLIFSKITLQIAVF